METRAEPGVTGRRLVRHSVAAAIRGVSSKTLDRWAAAGLIPAPRVINKRKYHFLADIDDVPVDQAREGQAA
jgi:predicted site-specific integrase-resolvase